MMGRRLLLAIASVAFTMMIAGGWWLMLRGPRPIAKKPPAAFAEVPIPEPHWGELERAAPEHVRQVRQRLEQAKSVSVPSRDQLAKAYGELGELYLAYDIPASAVPCFQNASQLDLVDFRWPYLQAAAHQALMDNQEAVNAMSEAVRRMRRTPSAGNENLVAALCFLGEATVRLNQMDKARHFLDEAIRLAPNSVFALFKRGQLASQAGDSQGAIADFQRAMSVYSGSKPAPISRALSVEYQKLNQRDEAAKYRQMSDNDAKETVIRCPNPLLARVRAMSQRLSAVQQRAQAENAKGNPQSALAQLNDGLKYSPDSIELLLLRAETLLQMNRMADVLQDLEAVEKSDPRNEQRRILLIQAYARTPETREKARDLATAWRDEQPTALRPQVVLANLEFQMEQFDKAYECFAAACSRHPQEVTPRLGEILALCAMGRYTTARERFDEALSLFPANTDLKHHFARFLVTCPEEALRDPEHGLTVARELLSVQKSVPLSETLACGLAACGKWDEARRQLSGVGDGDFGKSARSLRFQKIRESIENGKTWIERWPFAEVRDRAGP